MIKLKSGVRLRGLRPEMALAHTIVAAVYADYTTDCVITSANDSGHGWGSLHFAGAALDYRTNTVPDLVVKQELQLTIASALGEDFDVILENVGLPQEHLHVEYQSKRA